MRQDFWWLRQVIDTLSPRSRGPGWVWFSGVQYKEDRQASVFKEAPLSYTRSDHLIASLSFRKWILIMLCVHRQEMSIQKEWIIDNYFLCFIPSYNSTTNVILNEFSSSPWCFIFELHTVTSKLNSMKNQTAVENVSLIFPPIYHPLPCGSRLSAQLLGKWCLLSPSSLIKMMDPANLSSRFQIQFLFAGSLSQWYVTYLIYEIIAQINGTKLFFKLQSTVFSVI